MFLASHENIVAQDKVLFPMQNSSELIHKFTHTSGLYRLETVFLLQGLFSSLAKQKSILPMKGAQIV